MGIELKVINSLSFDTFIQTALFGDVFVILRGDHMYARYKAAQIAIKYILSREAKLH